MREHNVILDGLVNIRKRLVRTFPFTNRSHMQLGEIARHFSLFFQLHENLEGPQLLVDLEWSVFAAEEDLRRAFVEALRLEAEVFALVLVDWRCEEVLVVLEEGIEFTCLLVEVSLRSQHEIANRRCKKLFIVGERLIAIADELESELEHKIVNFVYVFHLKLLIA